MNKYLNNIFSSVLKNRTSKVKSEPLNLKQYYWDLNTFVYPKIYLFHVERDNTTTVEYIEFKKIGENLLQLTAYNEVFVKIKVLVQRFKENGVYVDSIAFVTVANPTQLTTPNTYSGFVFPFNSPQLLKEEYVYNDYFDEPVIIKQNIFRNFVNYNDPNPDVLKTEGRMHKTAYTKDGEFLRDYFCTTEMHYKKGFGVIYTSVVDKMGHYKRRYTKTITAKAFNALKEEV